MQQLARETRTQREPSATATDFLSLCLRTSKLDKPARLLRPCFWWRSMSTARKCAARVALQLTGCFLRQNRTMNPYEPWIDARENLLCPRFVRANDDWSRSNLWILPSFRAGILFAPVCINLFYWSLANYFRYFEELFKYWVKFRYFLNIYIYIRRWVKIAKDRVK